jgi:hypothetical protein
MHLFLLHDAAIFHDRLAPAVAESFRRRSFEPMRKFAHDFRETIGRASQRDRLIAAEQPLLYGCDPVRFDRRLWRHFSGELLLYAAAETPAFPTAPELLPQFIALPLVERLHGGSRDVDFGGASYRPGRSGIHESADVADLVVDLAAIDPATWTVDALAGCACDDGAEELAFARQCFDDLRAMFAAARERNQVIVCEEI